MNNKTLIAIIAGLVIVGGILVLAGQLGNKSKSTDSKTGSSTPASQIDANAGDGTPLTEPVDKVTMTSSGFEPASARVKKDKVVIWINKTGSETSIKSDSFAPLNLGRFPDGSSVQLIFDKVGTYNYYNELKPDQKGTIIVE